MDSDRTVAATLLDGPDDMAKEEEMNFGDHEVEQDFMPVLLLRVEEAALRLGVGRTSLYRLISAGEIESVQIGGLRRIPVPCLVEYVDRLRSRGPTAAGLDAGA